MSAIKTIQYAPGYPWGATKGTGSGYLVNNVAGYAIGATTLAADVGTGTILIGDFVTFAGDTVGYEVVTALSAGSFAIKSPGLLAAVVDNVAISVEPVWVTVTDWLEEDFEPGLENIVAARMGEGGEEQDAVELQGSFLATGANIPVGGQRNWFKFNPFTGTSQVAGSARGARTRTSKSNLRPIGGGAQYTRVEFSATGSVAGDTIEDANN